MSDYPFTLSDSTGQWLESRGFGTLEHCESLSDNATQGCFLLVSGNSPDRKIIAKIAYDDQTEGRINAEVKGLQSLANAGSIRTPNIEYSNHQCLLLEYITEGQQNSDYWQALAKGLVKLHQTTSKPTNAQLTAPYGLDYNNYCGVNLQVNGWFEDGHDFFAEQRLLHQARLAFDNGYLESPWIISIESICERLPELIPWQAPSLLHGDLWPGNILVDETGNPVLIDPAIYYGWREADIAMTLLFGGLPHDFYTYYEEYWPMESGWRKRVPLYNLYHLLNHLNIFGVNYLSEVHHCISRFA